jgi:hypothetical protein
MIYSTDGTEVPDESDEDGITFSVPQSTKDVGEWSAYSILLSNNKMSLRPTLIYCCIIKIKFHMVQRVAELLITVRLKGAREMRLTAPLLHLHTLMLTHLLSQSGRSLMELGGERSVASKVPMVVHCRMLDPMGL